MSKVFRDGLKTSPNNNSMGVSAEFSKFPVGWREKKQNMTLRLGDLIICLIMSALKKFTNKHSLSVINRPLQNIWLVLFRELNVVLEALQQ